MENIIINEKQAEVFAREILDDIDNYISEHQAEYEKFITKERGS